MVDPGPITPVIIKVIPAATPQVSVVDVLLGSFGLIGTILLGALLIGGMLGLLLILRSRRRVRNPLEGGSDGNIQLNLSAPMVADDAGARGSNPRDHG
jgi:hypothetical protein